MRFMFNKTLPKVRMMHAYHTNELSVHQSSTDHGLWKRYTRLPIAWVIFVITPCLCKTLLIYGASGCLMFSIMARGLILIGTAQDQLASSWAYVGFRLPLMKGAWPMTILSFTEAIQATGTVFLFFLSFERNITESISFEMSTPILALEILESLNTLTWCEHVGLSSQWLHPEKTRRNFTRALLGLFNQFVVWNLILSPIRKH